MLRAARQISPIVAFARPSVGTLKVGPLEETLGVPPLGVELAEGARVKAEQPSTRLAVEQPAVLRDDVPVALGLAVLDHAELVGGKPVGGGVAVDQQGAGHHQSSRRRSDRS
jgi:hypothetical protein